MNPSKRLKGLTALLLATTMTLVSPLTSLAVSKGEIEHNAGGTDTDGIPTGGGGDFSVNVSDDLKESGKIGIRLSLVDRNNPSKVISVDDSGNARVVDLLYVTSNQYDRQVYGKAMFGSPYLTDLEPQFIFSTVKTQDLGSLADSGTPSIYRLFRDKQLTYTDRISGEEKSFSLADMEPWVVHTGSYDSKGEEFVNWCVTNDDGVEVIGKSGDIFTVNVWGVPVPLKPVSGKPDVTVTHFLGDAPWTYITAGVTEEERNQSAIDWLVDTTGRVQEYHDRPDNEKIPIAIMNIANAYYGLNYFGTKYGTDSKQYTDREKEVTIALDNFADKLLTEDQIDIKTLWQNSDAATELKNQAKRQVSDEYAKTTDDGSTTDDESTVAKGNVTKQAHIHTLIGLKENGKYVLQTDSMRKGEAKSLEDATEDWVLLVEPVIWLSILPMDNPHKIVHSKLYGTISNIMEAFNRDKVKGWAGDYSDKLTFNWKAFNSMWSALHVKEDYTFGNGQKLLTLEDGGLKLGGNCIPKVLEQANQWGDDNAKVGYGVNVYWKFGLFGNPNDPDGSGGSGNSSYIRTWDRANYPNGDPAPAPDPSKLPQETNFGDNSKNFIITKWYVQRNTDINGNTTETVLDVKTRKETPHTVVIENEGNKDSSLYWEVEKWATGKDAIAPADGDRTSTFEDYYNKNTGTKGGTYPVILDMKPEDTDKILYVKLVAKKIIPPPTAPSLTIVKVKDSSDGTTAVEKFSGYPTDGKYNASDPGWDYLEDIQTPDPSKTVTTWQDVPQTGTPGATPNITVAPSTKTIYIHYQQSTPPPAGKTPLVLHQNELSHGYTLKNLHTDGTLAYIQEKFANKNYPIKGCTGHPRHDDDDGDFYTSPHRPTIADQRYKLSVTSSNNNPNFIADYAPANAWETFGYLSIGGTVMI